MDNKLKKNAIRQRRKNRVRAKIYGTKVRPRLSVYRSLNHTYAQLIDDEKGVTLVFASTRELSAKKKKSVQAAKEVGELLARKAKKADITQAVFDKSYYAYHGRIQALADAVRAGGVKF